MIRCVCECVVLCVHVYIVCNMYVYVCCIVVWVRRYVLCTVLCGRETLWGYERETAHLWFGCAYVYGKNKREGLEK